ncbi:MAG: family 20 glycosylhydrolase [Chloroflexi bacterium]|nr:family 20 glycosylhydrolase [Chloroflexota bacterium]
MQYLIPLPNAITLADTSTRYPAPLEGAISIPDPSLLFEAQWLQRALAQTGRTYTIRLSQAGAHIHLGYADGAGSQSYTLTVDEDIVIRGGDAAGVFYGCCTLRQLVLGEPDGLPVMTIEDAPAYAHRGYMLDISRDRVPTLEMLYQLVDELSALKYNQLRLYIEHTFEFPGHRVAWQHASPLTGEDVLLLDAYCKQRHVELTPNQNSLGHMERFPQARAVPLDGRIAAGVRGAGWRMARAEHAQPAAAGQPDLRPRPVRLAAAVLLQHAVQRRL